MPEANKATIQQFQQQLYNHKQNNYQYTDDWNLSPPNPWSYSESESFENNSTNFGSYDHPKFCDIGDPQYQLNDLFNDSGIFLGEYWAKDNAIIAAGYGANLTRYEFNRGATAEHAGIIGDFVNSQFLSQYTDSDEATYDYIDLESIAIYPIKKYNT